MLRPINKSDFLNYAWGLLKHKHCHLHRINAVEDHVHLLFALPPNLALADLVRDLKVATNLWLKQTGGVPDFEGWQEGYEAFTVSYGDIEVIKDYIAGQEEHHREFDFMDEFRELLAEFGLTPRENDPQFD